MECVSFGFIQPRCPVPRFNYIGLLNQGGEGVSGGSGFRLAKILRLFRIAKMLRLLRLRRIVERYQKYLCVRPLLMVGSVRLRLFLVV